MEDKNKELLWKETSREHLIRDHWIDFRKSSFRLPDGQEFGPYYSYSRRDYAVILASDEAGRFLCVKQFRPGVRRLTVEFPAGAIETEEQREDYESVTTEAHHCPSDDAAFASAKRELLEETGYESNEWHHLITIPSDATITDNYAYVFYARNCRKVASLRLDDTEYLEPEVLSADQINALIASGDFAQTVHLMAWMMMRAENLLPHRS